jgi:hypothetical protein
MLAYRRRDDSKRSRGVRVGVDEVRRFLVPEFEDRLHFRTLAPVRSK